MREHQNSHPPRVPWNKGKLIGQKAPLKLKEIWAIRIRLHLARGVRELALFDLGIDSKLRGCDLLGLRVCDVAQGGRVASRAIVMQRKTRRPVQFELTEQTREAVQAWITQAKLTGDQFLFPSRLHASPHLSTRQYAKIVDAWVSSIGLDPNEYGTHTMRRTKATLIYRRTRNLRAVQLLLGHTKLESTVRYLEIEVDDVLEIAEQTDVRMQRDRRRAGGRKPAKSRSRLMRQLVDRWPATWAAHCTARIHWRPGLPLYDGARRKRASFELASSSMALYAASKEARQVEPLRA